MIILPSRNVTPYAVSGTLTRERRHSVRCMVNPDRPWVLTLYLVTGEIVQRTFPLWSSALKAKSFHWRYGKDGVRVDAYSISYTGPDPAEERRSAERTRRSKLPS